MKIRSRIRILEAWAVVSSAALLVTLLTGAHGKHGKLAVEELTAERLDIVDERGRMLLVAANAAHMPDPVVDGRSWKTERPAGMLFYNGLGDENGGLIFGAVEGGGEYGAYHGLSFDKYKQAQVLALVYNDHSGKYRAGLRIWDRPETPLSEILARREAISAMREGGEKSAALRELEAEDFSPTRVYLGKNAASESELTLFDASGAPRVRICVTAAGEARMDFLDGSGKVTFTLPERPAARG